MASPLVVSAADRGPSLTSRERGPTGTDVSYRLNQEAVITFTVLEPTQGHWSGGKCLSGRSGRHQRRCTRFASVGSFTDRDRAGKVKVHFTGRVQGRPLRGGRYRLVLTPTADGRTGRAINLPFRILTPLRGGMILLIKVLDGGEFALDVDSEDTVEAVKQKIQDKRGFSPADQRLIFAGKELEDGRTLADYRLADGTTLHLVLRGCTDRRRPCPPG